ncbi:MAG: CPBP family intramembrane metalloprotease [Chloroflexi bacterium]|nr:CPBP family intramembrane metalloprotease [Chloroflexota bacterium]
MLETTILLITFGPLIGLLWLAQMADRQRRNPSSQPVAAVLTYGILLGLWSSLFLSGLLLSILGNVFQQAGRAAALAQSYAQVGLDPDVALAMIASLPQIGKGLWVAALVGGMLLLPVVRRLLARRLAIDPGSALHAVVLAYAVLVVVNLWVTLSIGLDQLANLVSSGQALPVADLINITWLQEILFALMALVGVGWLSQRHWGQAWQRLGVVRPTGRQLAVGVGIGLGLVVLLMPLDAWMTSLGLGENKDVARLTEQLIGPLSSTWLGVATLGLAAALGEETIFRGALQPRFGIFLTAILFALLHSTYGLTLSTGVVLFLGLVLGWVRRRYNTSTAMVVHATYNMALGLATMWALWPQ